MYSRDDLKEFIKENLIGKQKSVPKSRQTLRWYEIRNTTDYYHSIIEITNYLPEDTTFNERCYQILHDMKKSPTCKECNNLTKYFSFVDGYREYCQPKCATKGKKQIDTFIKKYGDVEGRKKYDTMIKNKTQSEERFIELYGEKEGKKRWKQRNKKCTKNGSLEGFIERFGVEQGKIKYLEYIGKLKKSHSLSGYIHRYGEEIGTEKYNETIRKKAQTLDRFIELYGDEDGLAKFKEYKKKLSVNQMSNVSEESLNFFKPLLEHLLRICYNENILNGTYIGGRNSQEYFLLDKDLDKTYFYDLTIEPLKLIFEYNGSAFHPNKNKLTESEWNSWKSPFSGEDANARYNFDRRKISVAEISGFDVIEVWDTDNVDDALVKCKSTIEEKMDLLYGR